MSQPQFMEGPCAPRAHDRQPHEHQRSDTTTDAARTHYRSQRRALDAAYAELAPVYMSGRHFVDARLDSLHQAYVEMLCKLEENPDWCFDGPVPSVHVARLQLAFRVRGRQIDAWRRRRERVVIDDVESLGASSPDGPRDGGLRELHAYLRSHLSEAEHAKLDRFVQHAILDMPHQAIALRHAMSHEAVRTESRRFAKRIAPLLEGYAA